ncbi:glycosyltransferase family 2 protein [Mucilaginibacter gynuensis]|uniref:Glycosyltransferase family 2 protein n=1 Tax=Mucilaginibacter gynuensis TaxID=1302236 RepID=A0ABP8H745_9SPHI
MKKISIVVPAHNEEKNIAALVSELYKLFSNLAYDFECIFVDDGSKDNTLNEIKIQTEIHPEVHYVELARNFGKDQALQAGIQMATGDAVITMDADLQHPPQLITEMVKYWEQDYDVVYTYREKTNAHAKTYQKVSSKLFYKGLNMLSDIQLEDGIADFRLLDKKVVQQLRQLNEYEIFFRGMVKWVGFRQIGIPYNPAERLSGEASYSFFKLFKLAINSIMSFSVKPLYMVTGVGIVFSVGSLLYIPYIIISYLLHINVSGWASIIATIAFFGGLQLFVLGIIGMYLGKLFMQAKQRPSFIIRSANFIKTDYDLVKL